MQLPLSEHILARRLNFFPVEPLVPLDAEHFRELPLERVGQREFDVGCLHVPYTFEILRAPILYVTDILNLIFLFTSSILNSTRLFQVGQLCTFLELSMVGGPSDWEFYLETAQILEQLMSHSVSFSSSPKPKFLDHSTSFFVQ